MSKKNRLFMLLLPLSLLLVGCGHISVSDGGIWSKVGVLFAKMIVFLSEIAGNSLGMGIILATLVIRILILPLYAKQIKSQEEMKKVQPLVKKVQDKYKDKKDTESKQKMQAEVGAIYKEHGISPLAGCLPLLIQMPILILFYSSLTYLVPSASVIEAAKKSGDTVVYGLKELGVDGVLDTYFFGESLNDPQILFAILAALGTLATSYLTQLGTDNSDNPAGASMKIMMYMMPVITFVIGLQLPAALGLYWVAGSVFTVIQTLYTKRHHIRTAMDRRKMNSSKK